MLDIIRILQIIKKYKVKIILCDPPVFLIHGNTSDVTQCLKRFADSSLLLRMRVETGFVNDSHFLDSVRCFHFGNTFIFYFNSFRYCTSRFCISQRHSHIFSHKPWLSINLNAAQISKFWMIEGLTLRSGRGRRSRSCGWCNWSKFIKPLP